MSCEGSGIMTESIKNTVIGGVFPIIGAAIGAFGMYISSDNSDQTVRGKVILQPHGKEFFTWYSKHLFTLHGKHFFT